MPRSKSPKSAWLPVAIPTHDKWTPKVGASVTVNRGKGGRPAWAVPRPAALGPMLLSDVIEVSSPTNEEFAKLEKALAVSLSKQERDAIDAENTKLIASIALYKRMPSSKEVATRLKQIIDVGESCRESANQFVKLTCLDDEEQEKGIISVDYWTKAYIELSTRGAWVMNIDIETVLAVCHSGLKVAKPFASKRGPKPGVPLRIFLVSLVHTARRSGAKLTLPSNESRAKHGTRRTTPLIRFACEALKIAVSKGIKALEVAPLSDAEKDKALHVLKYYETIAVPAKLLERLRNARESEGAN